MKKQRIYELYKDEKFGEDIIENIRVRIKKEKDDKTNNINILNENYESKKTTD